jgi:hypothetical protein
MDPATFSAGVLPFCDDPQGNRYVLLGKEDTVLRFGSRRWADFGGSAKGDETPEQTAAREFVEETMGAVPFFRSDVGQPPRTQWDDIVKHLEHNNYAAKVRMESGRRKPSVTFVCNVPWDPDAQSMFATMRSVADVVQRGQHCMSAASQPWVHPMLRIGTNAHGSAIVGVESEWAEKRALRLWSLPSLRLVRDNNGLLQGEYFRHAFVATLTPLLDLLAGVTEPQLHGAVELKPWKVMP